MKRRAALERAARHYDGGAFLADLARLVAVPSESQQARGALLVRWACSRL